MPRTPDEIITDISNVLTGDIDISSKIWEVIEDVRSSYRLAMEGLLPPLDPDKIDEVQDTVRDYLTNYWGEL